METENLTYEMLTDAQKAIHDAIFPDQYYQYGLKGTVVHYGTADAGHYYSYIKDRSQKDKWYEFNDSWVIEFNPDNLERDTFGGPYKKGEEPSYMKTKKPVDKMYNAYVLIYERNQFVDTKRLIEERKPYESLMIPEVNLGTLRVQEYIEEEVRNSNSEYWLVNKIFNKTFLQSVTSMLTSLHIPECEDYSSDWLPDIQTKFPNLQTLKFATLFLFTAVNRSEPRKNLAKVLQPYIIKACEINTQFAIWILDSFC
jgi:hypothetical protein